MAFHYRTRSNEEMERRLNQSGSDFEHYIKDEYRLFRPQNENTIRVLPPSSHWPIADKEAPHWGLDVYVHFSIGPSQGSVICLDHGVPQIGRKGLACPVCQEQKRAERAHDEVLARDLRPVKRVLTWILDRKDEPKGPLLWGMPFTVDVSINKKAKDRGTGGWFLIDRPEDGYDIYIDKTGERLNTKYDVVGLADRPSPVADKWIEYVDQNPLHECLRWRDYDEIKRLFEGRGRGEDPEAVRNERAEDRGDEQRDEPRRGERRDDRRQSAEPERAPRPPRDEPVRRPGSRAAAEPPQDEGRTAGNGADDEPPFETETRRRPAEPNAAAGPPSNDAKTRAEELRAQFLSRRDGGR